MLSCYYFSFILLRCKQYGIFVKHTTYIEKLKALNKCILRFILNDYTSHYTTLLNKVEMTSLYNMCIQNSLILVYKSLFLNQYPTYMRNMFAVRHKAYNLRNTHMLTLSKHRTTTYTLHSFPSFSTQQWNALPDELRNSTFSDLKQHVQSLNMLD